MLATTPLLLCAAGWVLAGGIVPTSDPVPTTAASPNEPVEDANSLPSGLTVPPQPVAQPNDVTPAPAPAAGADTGAAVLQTQQNGGMTLRRPSNVHEGQLLVVEVRGPDTCKAPPTVQWQGTTFNTFEVREGWYHALLPVSLTVKLTPHHLTVECGGKRGGFDVALSPGTFPESRLSVDPKFTSPPPPRAANERAAITACMSGPSMPRAWTTPFAKPAAGIETSPFGVRRTFNGQTKSRHMGEDFDGKVGETLWAANDGVVVLAADDFFYVGNAVFIDHGDHLYTMYFHMTQTAVKTGDKVVRGQMIGNLGSTGRVTGPHVHFAVKLAGTYVNPADLLSYNPTMLLGDALKLVATDH